MLKGLKESKSRTIFDFSVLRWVCLVLLLVTELVWLSLRVDFHPLSGNESWWGGTLSHSNIFASIGLASLAAGLVVGWARGIGKFREGLKFRDISLKTWLLILAQLTAFAIFSWLSIIVTSSQFSALWIFAWAGAGFGTAIFWLLAAMPPRAWFRLSRQGWLIALVALVIGTAAWVLGFLADMTWEPLLRPTFWFVQWLLRALAQEVVSRPADFVLGTKQFSIEIYPPCSGYQGMGLIVVFVGAYLWLFRRRLRFPQAFFLLPFGVLIIWLVNTLRIASLILFGTYGSAEIALGGFHSQTGWLGFILVALGLITASQRIPFFVVTQHNSKVKIEDDAKPKVETRVKDEIEENKPKAEKKAKVIKPTTAYLGPLMVLLAISMINGMFSSGFDWLYPTRVFGTGAAIWFFWGKRRESSTDHGSQSTGEAATWQLTKIRSWWSAGAIGIGVAVFALWVGMEWATANPVTGSSIKKSLGEMPIGLAAGWLVFRVLGSVVIVPIAEELAFRGYLLRRLISADFEKLSPPQFTWLSFLGSSVLYGAMHGRLMAGIVSGMFYAWPMYRRGKVGGSIVAHATTNALIATDALLFGQWGIWT